VGRGIGEFELRGMGTLFDAFLLAVSVFHGDSVGVSRRL
jgi:hypothetical protein